MTVRNKYFLFSLLAVAVMAVFCFWNGGQEENNPNTLYFSREPGFYDTAFSLEILSDSNADVFYTLDGSTPTRDSIPYTGPIWLSDPSNQPDRYACIAETSTGFRQDLVAQMPGYGHFLPGYVVPDRVDKCNVLRAAAYDGEVCLGTITGTYFVGMQEKPVYDGFCLVSLVTDPDNLFDSDNGIYVTGQEFSYFMENADLEAYPWQFWDANYHQRGRDYERPAHIEVFTEDRSALLSSPCGIRVHGNMSRAFLPKSLNVYARRAYSGSDVFSPSPIPGGQTLPSKCMLFAGGNDNCFLLKDAMVQQLCADLNMATMDMYPCMVFLDGEFWGASYLSEAYDSKYISDHYGIPEDSVVMVKVGALSEGTEADLADYQKMVDFITNQDMTVAENYAQAKERIDVESYADYFATQIYIARHMDWPIENVALWRAKTTPVENSWRDGKWRWMLFDCNSEGMESAYTQLDTMKMAMELDSLFASLCENPEFKALLSQRLYHVATEVFSQENCDRYLAKYREEIVPAVQAGNLRFYGEDKAREIQDNIQDIALFFRERPAFLDTMIAQNLGEEYVQCSTAMN